MGIQKQKWTNEEEEALRAGVAKHGVGKWKNILVDSDLGPRLLNRSNVDLKDKWRNMYGSHGQASTKTLDTDNHPAPTSTNVLKYNAMIVEALSSLKDPRGSQMSAIASFIQQKYEVPRNFRRLLSAKLRKLVLQGKIEKDQRNFRLYDSALGTKTPSPKRKYIRSRPFQQSGLTITRETSEDRAKMIAHKIAEAENKAFVAAEGVKEYERILHMVADSDAVVTVFTEIFEQCCRGEVFLVD